MFSNDNAHFVLEGHQLGIVSVDKQNIYPYILYNYVGFLMSHDNAYFIVGMMTS